VTRPESAPAASRWSAVVLCVIAVATAIVAEAARADGREVRRASANAASIVFQQTNLRGQRAVEEIWTMAADGSRPRFITEGSGPRWSPDRRWIAFDRADFSREKAGDEIWLIRADGTGLRQLTNVYPMQARTPASSPDGRKIAFLRSEPGFTARSGIWVVNVDGSGCDN
jgi:tricorn protease-like protein